MYKYLQEYLEFMEKYPIDTRYIPISGISFEEAEQLRISNNFTKWPASVYEMAQLISLDNLKDNMAIEERKFWLKHLYPRIPRIKDIFIMYNYLHDDVSFIVCDENENPPVLLYNLNKKVRLMYPTLGDYLLAGYRSAYNRFLSDLAGRYELRKRVEQAKAILKPLYETANALITPYATDAKERQSFRMALWGLDLLYKELFYNPYLLRYHSDYSKWEAEMINNNDIVIKYLGLILPAFEKENPPAATRISQLRDQFHNFETTIRWVAASPDATIRKPSPAAQNAAKEERDITDFLL